MANLFKQGRAIGKGVRYLTQLGSKIGKSIGSSVDKLGAGTRSTQAATIKGARGVRDAAQSAGRGIAEGARTARAGYNSGRSGSLHLSDVADKMPTKSTGGKKLPSLGEWMNTHGKQYMRNPGTMPGNKPDNAGRYKTVGDMYKGVGRDNAGRISNAKNIAEGKARRASASSPGYNGKNWAVPVNNPSIPKKHINSMRKGVSGGMVKGSGGIINKPPGRPTAGAGDYMSNSPKGNKYTIGPRYSDDVFAAREIAKNGSRMASKNRRAGIITLGAAGAGYGVHKGNEALQNHYQRQKNASR
jgi:hypothetical protein